MSRSNRRISSRAAFSSCSRLSSRAWSLMLSSRSGRRVSSSAVSCWMRLVSRTICSFGSIARLYSRYCGGMSPRWPFASAAYISSWVKAWRLPLSTNENTRKSSSVKDRCLPFSTLAAAERNGAYILHQFFTVVWLRFKRLQTCRVEYNMPVIVTSCPALSQVLCCFLARRNCEWMKRCDRPSAQGMKPFDEIRYNALVQVATCLH